MATLSLKPSERYQLSDWHNNSYLLSTNAEQQREASYQIRQEARVLRNETNNQVGGGGAGDQWVGKGTGGEVFDHWHYSFHLALCSRPFGMNVTIRNGWQRGLILSTA